MKKLLFLGFFCSAILSTTYAQTGGPANTQGTSASAMNPATVLQQMKAAQKPLMVEKTGLSEAQADKVIEINFEIRQSAMGLRDLNEADRSKKIAELKATKEKRYSEIPLTADQIKAVYAFYEDMGKNMPQKN